MPPDFQQLTSHLWSIQSELYATNSGVFISAGEACLIDPALTPETLEEIGAFVDAQGAEPARILLTHAHWDHILGPERFPNVPVVAQACYRDVVTAEETKLRRQIATWAAESGIPRSEPFTPPRPDLTFDLSLRLPVGRETLHLLHMPGHAPDQCVVYHAPSGLLWAGDMLSDLEIPFVSDSLIAYERTLERLSALDIRTLVPGHGHATRDPAEIQRRLAEDRIYLTTLHQCVDEQVRAGATLAETLVHCADIPFRHPEENALPHRRNVANAYAELMENPPTGLGWESEFEED